MLFLVTIQAGPTDNGSHQVIQRQHNINNDYLLLTHITAFVLENFQKSPDDDDDDEGLNIYIYSLDTEGAVK
jgi:hypothetical protein